MNLKPVYWTFGIVTGTYLAALLYRQYSLLKETEFKVKSVVKKNLSLTNIDIELTAEIVNHSNIQFTILSQDFNVFYNDVFVGTVSNPNEINIPKNGKSLSTYRIVIDPKQLLSVGNPFAGRIRIKGGAYTKSGKILIGRIPIDLSFGLTDFIK